MSLTKKEISIKNLKYNLEQIKRSMPNKKICAMVKANAYGHGAVEIVNAIKGEIDFFGVANLAEALEIRKFCHNNILIVGAVEDYAHAIENDISFAIHSKNEMAKLINVMNNYAKSKKARIHIKINSGMNRFGVKSISEFREILRLIDERIELEGVFTHFSTVGSDQDIFNFQARKFNNFLKELPNNISPIVHVGGSGIVLASNNFVKSKMPYIVPNVNPDFDMFRVGIMLYGYGDNGYLNLKKVMKIKTHIVQIQNVKKGEYVGYGTSFKAEKDMTVGIIPIGYADGLSRKLSNIGSVKLKLFYGDKYCLKTCRIIGNICMDLAFIDLTDVDLASIKYVLILDDADKMAKKNWHNILWNIDQF